MTEAMPFVAPAIGPQPDAATSYAAAFQVGRSLARAGSAARAAPQTSLGSGGPNAAVGDIAHLAAQIDAMPPAKRGAVIARAQESNEQLAHVLIGLRSYPPDQRLAIARHLAQTMGLIDPNGVGDGDVSDQGIDAHLAQAMSVEQFLKREQLYASIPLPAESHAEPGAPSLTARDAPRANSTGADHLTNVQLSTALGL